jgi:hypothetical protein
MATCLKCKRRNAYEKLFLMLYDKKTNDSPFDEKQSNAGPQIIGSLRAAVCPHCLAKLAWKTVGRALLLFVAKTAAVLLLAWLLSNLLQVAWIGGGLIWLGLCVDLVKRLGSAVKTADRLGAGRYAYDDYLKQGVIPKGDFLWIGEDSRDMFSEFGLTLKKSENFNPDDLMLVDEQTAKETIAKTPTMTEDEKSKLIHAFSAAEKIASHDTKLPTVLKCFWQPVVASLNLAVALLTAFLFVEETSNLAEFGGSVLPLVLAILSGMSGISGAILLLRQKKQGYIFTALMLGLLWFFAIGSGSQIIKDGSILLTILVALPALLYLPFLKGYPPTKHGAASEAEGM